MGRHKYIKCDVCSKDIRSDNMKKHTHKDKLKKYPMKSCSICKKNMVRNNLSRHMKTHDLKSKEIMVDILKNQSEFNEKRETGSLIKRLLEKQDIDAEAIPKEYVEVLKLNSQTPLSNISLRI